MPLLPVDLDVTPGWTPSPGFWLTARLAEGLAGWPAGLRRWRNHRRNLRLSRVVAAAAAAAAAAVAAAAAALVAATVACGSGRSLGRAL